MFTMDGTGAGSSMNVNDFNFLDWVGDYAELRGQQSETSTAVAEPILDYANMTTWDGRYDQPGPSTRAGTGGTNISGNGLDVGAGFPGPSSSFPGGDGDNLFSRSYNADIDMFMAQAQRYRHGQNPQLPAAPGYTHMVQPIPLSYPLGEQTASFGAANWRFGQPSFEMTMNNSTSAETVGRPSKRLRYDTTEPGGPSAEHYAPGPSALSGPEYNPSFLPNDLDFSNLDPDLLAEFLTSQAHDSSAPSSSDQMNAFMVPLPDPVAGPSRPHTTWNFPSDEHIPAASQSPIAAVLPPDPFSFPTAAYKAAVAGPSQPSHAPPDPEIPPHGGYSNWNPVPSPQQTFVSHPVMSDGANNARHQAPPQHSNGEVNPEDAGEDDAYVCKWVIKGKPCGYESKSSKSFSSHCWSHIDRKAHQVSCCWQRCRSKKPMKVAGFYRHIRIHYEPRVQCEWCEGYFSRVDSRTRHKRTCSSRPSMAEFSESMQGGILEEPQNEASPSQPQILADLLGSGRQDASEFGSEARVPTEPPESEFSQAVDGPSQSRATSEDSARARETHEAPASNEGTITTRRLRAVTQEPTLEEMRPTRRRKAAPRVRRAEKKGKTKVQREAETTHLQNGMTLRPRQAARAPTSDRGEGSSGSNEASTTDEPAQDSGSHEDIPRALDDKGDQHVRSFKRKRH